MNYSIFLEQEFNRVLELRYGFANIQYDLNNLLIENNSYNRT